MLDPEGPRRKGLVIETLVTTKLLGKIVAARGESDLIDDLLVGFKYVADVLKRLGREGEYREMQRRPEELVLAAEESHGVIALPHILDKDATPACMYLAGLYQRLRLAGAHAARLLRRHPGTAGRLRHRQPLDHDGRRQRHAAQGPDHGLAAQLAPASSWRATRSRRWSTTGTRRRFGPLVSESERLPRNVIQLQTGRLRGHRASVGHGAQAEVLLPAVAGSRAARPARGRAAASCCRRSAQEAEAAARTIYNDLLAPLGVKLGEVGLALTDLIELDRKQEFERDTLPRLRQAIAGGQLGDLDQLVAWLRAESRRSCCRGPTPCPPCAGHWRWWPPPGPGNCRALAGAASAVRTSPAAAGDRDERQARTR